MYGTRVFIAANSRNLTTWRKEGGQEGEILSEFLATFNKFSLSAQSKTFLRLILNTGNFKLGGRGGNIEEGSSLTSAFLEIDRHLDGNGEKHVKCYN